MTRLLAAAAIAVGLFLYSTSSNASTLDVGSWTHVARMAPDGGMFDGNGNLLPNYTFGTNTGNPLQSNDFQIPFNVYAGMDILFMTGDQQIWGKTSYSTLRSLIDSAQGTFSPNIQFQSRVNGVELTTMGNVLSRAGAPEDPWISLMGDHSQGIMMSLILWGEVDFQGPHVNLSQTHNGVNVYVSNFIAQTPLPGALVLFLSGLMGVGGFNWIRRWKLGLSRVAIR